MRDKSVKTFLSLCLLNLFLFLQLVAASEQISQSISHGKDPKFRCAVSHQGWHVDAEIVSTDILIVDPGYFFVAEKSEVLLSLSADEVFNPGRGPPLFHA